MTKKFALAAVLLILTLPCQAQESPSNYTVTELKYADKSPSETLDLYLPKAGSAPFPLVIWIHGGGWEVGDKKSIPFKDMGPPSVPVSPMGPYQIQVPDVEALTGKGYAVVSLNYRLGHNKRNAFLTRIIGPDKGEAILDSVRDAKSAVRFLRANADSYKLDSSKFAAWGNSAGGYMASMLGTTGDQTTLFDDASLGNEKQSSAVQAVIVWYGAEDRIPSPLGLEDYIATAKTLPPFRIVNGDADPVISPARAKRLHEALTQAGGISTLTILPGAGHEDPAFMATQMAPAFAFLDKVFGR